MFYQIMSLFSFFYSQLSSYESYITDLISDTLGFLGSSRDFLKKGAIILVGK
jgi:hypothetical protein